MKFLILSLFVFSLNSFAGTTIERTFDGKNASCAIKGDVGKRAYKVQLVSEKIVDDRREITLAVKFFKCDERDGKLSLVDSSASEVTRSYVLLSNGELGQTKNTLLAAQFALTDKFERFLGKAALNLNSADSTLNFSLDKSVERAFLTAAFKSSVEMPTGEVVGDVFEYFGGFVLNF